MEENYLIEKWLNDTLTADEKEAFERMEDAKAYKEIMQEAQRFSASGQLNPASLKSIETRIAMKAAPKRLSFKRYYKGVAAAAILVFGLLWIWKQTPMVSYETAVGEQLALSKILSTEPSFIVVCKNKLAALELGMRASCSGVVTISSSSVLQELKLKRPRRNITV